MSIWTGLYATEDVSPAERRRQWALDRAIQTAASRNAVDLARHFEAYLLGPGLGEVAEVAVRAAAAVKAPDRS